MILQEPNRKFSAQEFFSQPCSYTALFAQERFLGKKFPHGIPPPKKNPSEVLFRRSLLAGTLLLSSLFEFSERDVFQETTEKFVGKVSWQENFWARIRCKKILA
jgi:hypothetical protein